jgi:uncharacterized protein (DUF305 family)
MKLTRRTFLATAVVAGGTALLAACGAASSNNNHSSGGAHSSSASAEYDQSFIDGMVPHHLAAVDMAKIAQQQAEHAEIKQMANDIVTSQSKEIDQLKAWRKAWYGSDVIPAGGAAHMAGMDTDLKQLEAASPFDKAFIDAMLPHHQSAIEMATEAQAKAKHNEIKQLAKEIVAAQQREVDQMKAWRSQWYPGQ